MTHSSIALKVYTKWWLCLISLVHIGALDMLHLHGHNQKICLFVTGGEDVTDIFVSSLVNMLHAILLTRKLIT